MHSIGNILTHVLTKLWKHFHLRLRVVSHTQKLINYNKLAVICLVTKMLTSYLIAAKRSQIVFEHFLRYKIFRIKNVKFFFVYASGIFVSSCIIYSGCSVI